MWGKIIAVATVLISACPGQVAASCINPPHLQFAELLDQYLLEQKFEVGSHITYRCLPGYTFNNSESVSIGCQSNLNWSEPLFHCVAIDCGPPEDIQNGTYIAPDHSFGLTATYSCNVGFVIIGRTVRRCTAQGWSGRLPACRRVRCLKPEPVANGKIKAGFRDLYLYQNSIEYECDAGYQLLGDSVITCTSRRIWDLPTPTCHPTVPSFKIELYYLPNNKVRFIIGRSRLNDGFPDIDLTQNSFTVGTRVRYRCHPGFLLAEGISPLITCQADTSWTAIRTQCEVSSTTVYNENLLNTVANTTIDGIIDRTTASFQQPRATSTVGYNNSLDNHTGSSAAKQKWAYVGGLGFILIIAVGIIGKKYYNRKQGSYNTKSKHAVYPKDEEQSDVGKTSQSASQDLKGSVYKEQSSV